MLWGFLGILLMTIGIVGPFAVLLADDWKQAVFAIVAFTFMFSMIFGGAALLDYGVSA